MLRRFGYKVITAKRATDALCIARARKHELSVVLTEVYLPDMDKYQLLETMGEMFKLPVVAMSVDDDENAMLGCLFKGAAFCLVKPITMNSIKNLWQYAFMKKMERMIASDEMGSIQGKSQQENALDEGIDLQSFGDEGKQIYRNAKRKEQEKMDQYEEEDDDSAVVKKPKLVWTDRLHKRFLQAITMLGIDRAHPKEILQFMNIPGLKKENISSHLQKYRISLKREQDTIRKAMKRDFDAARLPSNHPLSTFHLRGGFAQFPKLQSMMKAYQPEFKSHFQKNFNSCMSMPSLGSMHFLDHAHSHCNDMSKSTYEQLTRETNQLDSTYPNPIIGGITITGNGDLAGFHQSRSSSREEFLKGKMALSNIGDSGLTALTNIIQHSKQQKQQQQQHQEQFLMPQSSPQLPSLPQEQEEHDFFGAERGQIDDLFDMAKGSSQLFRDEDLDDLCVYSDKVMKRS